MSIFKIKGNKTKFRTIMLIGTETRAENEMVISGERISAMKRVIDMFHQVYEILSLQWK